MGDRLVEDGEPIARRAFRRACHQRQRLGLGPHTLGRDDMGEVIGQLVRRDALQVEALAARQYRHRHLGQLRRRQQELHMRRRLLQRLEERVERVLRQHVDFVDNVDLVARAERGQPRRLDHLADIIDARMAGGVHLDHVDMTALCDGNTGLANAAGVDRRPALPVRPDAVERLGDQAGGGGLADAAHAGQQEGMGEAAAPDPHCPASAPSRPARSARRSAAGGICGRGPDRVWRIRTSLIL